VDTKPRKGFEQVELRRRYGRQVRVSIPKKKKKTVETVETVRTPSPGTKSRRRFGSKKKKKTDIKSNTQSGNIYEAEKTIRFEKKNGHQVREQSLDHSPAGHTLIGYSIGEDIPQSLVRGAEAFLIPCIHIGLPSVRRSFLFPVPVSMTSTFSSHSLARHLTSLTGLNTNGEKKSSA
jgi:hypothetical protein